MKIIPTLLIILSLFYSCTEDRSNKATLGKNETAALVVQASPESQLPEAGKPTEIDGLTRNICSHDSPFDGQEGSEAKSVVNDTIIDANYSFEEAIAGTKAPQSIIDQLVLFDVIYLSTDRKIHRGQILSNKEIAEDIKAIFQFMLNEEFIVEKAIPVVRYDWNDSLSMDANNSYSFCYRNITYSKHATGLAIDINPRFNPVRWKTENRPNQPEGAVLDTTVNGALFPEHPVVKEFRRLGFRWGHSFSKFYDDHHFEKAQLSLSKLR